MTKYSEYEKIDLIKKQEGIVAKTAKMFMASAMAFVEILLCENCRKLIFGGGKVQGIRSVERPKVCPQCGEEIDIQLKALSEKEIMSYAEEDHQ